MRGKLIFIFLTCLFAFYLLTAPVNAQKTMSVKEFNTNYPPVEIREKRVQDHVIISGFIRDINREEYYGYYFTVDDGTDSTIVIYPGGLGDIKEGDKIFVEINPSEPIFSGGSYGPGTVLQMPTGYVVVVSSVSKNLVSKPEEASAPKTPGFEIVIGAVAMLCAWEKLLKRR